MDIPKAWRIAVATMVGGAGLFVSDTFWTTTGPAHFTTQAEAIIGRPLTPLSVAGVARRTTRRAVAAGAIGYGAYAVGRYGYPYNYGYTNYGSNYPYSNYGYANYGSNYPYNYGYRGTIAASRPWYGYGGAGYDYGSSYYGYNPGYSTGDSTGTDYDLGYYGWNPGYSTSYSTSGGQDSAYCAQRFRSYDPGSGTYLGYDGQRHPCP